MLVKTRRWDAFSCLNTSGLICGFPSLLHSLPLKPVTLIAASVLGAPALWANTHLNLWCLLLTHPYLICLGQQQSFLSSGCSTGKRVFVLNRSICLLAWNVSCPDKVSVLHNVVTDRTFWFTEGLLYRARLGQEWRWCNRAGLESQLWPRLNWQCCTYRKSNSE